MCDQQSLRSACAYAQSDQSLCLSLEYSMTVKLLNEHHLEFLHLKGGCTGSSESTHVKMPHCWKSHVTAHITLLYHYFLAGVLCRDNYDVGGMVAAAAVGVIFLVAAIFMAVFICFW